MHGEIRRIIPIDVPDWPTWAPKTHEDEYQCFIVEIGQHGAIGTDDYQALVATTRGLEAHGISLDSFKGFVVETFSPGLIERVISDFVMGTEEETWDAVVRKLSSVMRWEFA